MVRQPDGDFRPDPDDAPAHHWRCAFPDMPGWTHGPAEDRVPVACPLCRPHLAVRRSDPHRRPRLVSR